MSAVEQSLSLKIRNSDKTRAVVETSLATDQRILARITDGIYRQPASALRELISNAYDADATEVFILTDAPRFSNITIRDNGSGMSPESLEHLIEHIGGSAKRTEEGKGLGVTNEEDSNYSPGGRQLIGKMGIGLFSVAQFTRHFLIITKTNGDSHRTIADITLGPVAGGQSPHESITPKEIETGHARIWREPTEDLESHGTEIKLLELLPRTRAELASEDLWTKIDFEKEDPEAVKTIPPRLHIGRMLPKQQTLLEIEPSLPWENSDSPQEKFEKFIQAVRESVELDSEHVDLDQLCDRYLRTIWDLATAAPLRYAEGHPFDITKLAGFKVFQLENKTKGQAKEIPIGIGKSPRDILGLTAPNGTNGAPFSVNFDGVELQRPVLFEDLPSTKTALQTPLLFIGRDRQEFQGKPISLSGGPLSFEAYLFWAPKIIPKQHQGVILRVGNASGAPFDRTFMSYQVSEQTRLRQITAEIFIHEGLDGAINLDRESFNFAHPHYQYLVKWLHSALRQLTNKSKELGKTLRANRVASEGTKIRAQLDEKVDKSLKSRGVEDLPEVKFIGNSSQDDLGKMRHEGTIVFRKEFLIPPTPGRRTTVQDEKRKMAETKAKAITQLLHGWGLLENLSYNDQELLLRDLMEIVMLDS